MEPKEDALENLQWIDKENDLAVSIERKSVVKVLDKKGDFVDGLAVLGEVDRALDRRLIDVGRARSRRLTRVGS